MSEPTIRMTRADERVLVEDPPVPGVRREMALAEAGHWAGLVTTDPGRDTGWHHHGDYDTFVYLVSGRARIEFGRGGRQALEGGAGGFAFVPKGVIHREINPGDRPNEAVVIRVGTGVPVVPVDGPEPGP